MQKNLVTATPNKLYNTMHIFYNKERNAVTSLAMYGHVAVQMVILCRSLKENVWRRMRLFVGLGWVKAC